MKWALAILLLAMGLIRAYYSAKAGWIWDARARCGPGETAFRLLGAAAFLLTLVYLFTSWLDALDAPLPGPIRWLGGLILLLGDLLFWWSHASLGRNWSPIPRIVSGQRLITKGPFRYVRHPMYSSWFLICTGVSLLTANWLLAPTYLGSAVALYVARVPVEERMLVREFGDEYRRYMARTGKMAPRLRR